VPLRLLHQRAQQHVGEPVEKPGGRRLVVVHSVQEGAGTENELACACVYVCVCISSMLCMKQYVCVVWTYDNVYTLYVCL